MSSRNLGIACIAVISTPLLGLAYYALPYSLLGIPVIMLWFIYFLWRRFDD